MEFGVGKRYNGHGRRAESAPSSGPRTVQRSGATSNGGRLARAGWSADREREILQLIGEGSTNKEIAQKVKLYLNTIQVHRRNLMQKLNIDKRAELIW